MGARSPGMVYILVSFIPWITYWVLCGFWEELSIIIPLAISSLLLIPQVRRGELNSMDVTSLIYFAVAAAITYFFNSRTFIEYSGSLGYLALFLMASLSVAMNQPFTFQVSKREWPEAYWRERSFLIINNIISCFWASVFLINSMIFAFLKPPITLILSNSLIALGMVLSAIMPSRLAARFIARDLLREFRKHDWKVELNPNRPKGEDEYDAIIVGSGIGGLTCGALLSKRGYKVLVLEQHYQVGGYCSSFSRKGFIFNTGVEDVSGLWDKGPVAYLLYELGIKRDDAFVRNRTRFVFRGRTVEASSLEELVKLLSEMFPEERENIETFFEEAKRAYEECYEEANIYGVPLPAELIAKVFGLKKLVDYPREHPHFYDWMNKTFRQKLDEYFRSEDLKAFLSALSSYIGAPPERVSASSALTACVSYYLHGGYFPRGGAKKFAESLREFIERRGGKVLLRHRVDRIIVEGGEVRGVRVGDKVFRSPIVVANVNAKTALLELVGEEHLSEEYASYIRELRMSPSCFMVFLGVGMNLSNYPTLIKELDEGYEIAINSNADPSLAPEGCASVTIITGANYHDFPERGTDGYLKRKSEIADSLIRKAEKLIPGLSGKIIVKDAATPRTFERYTSMPEGAIYSFDQSVETRRPYFKTPIRGLYLASASTFPGGGVEAVVISGIICANDICDWSYK